MSTANDVLWVIDLDRTLMDGDLPDALFTEVCAPDPADRQILAKAKTDLEARGGSFDVMEYLKSTGTSDKELDDLSEKFITKAAERDLLYPDARPLLAAADAAGIQTLILTYGSVSWQLTKLRAAGLTDRPFLITDDKQKGRLVASWRGAAGYEITLEDGQRLTAGSIRLIDDKASSFYGLPLDSSGYLIRRTTVPVLESQKGDIPQNVSIRHDLSSLLVDLG